MANNLRIVKRLAADILNVGRNRVILDPSATSKMNDVSARSGVRKLIKEHIVVKRAIKGQSRSRTRMYAEGKRKGRHMGLGKRRGSKNARCSEKRVWIVRQRVLRRLLRKLREAKKIDSQVYHTYYLKAKGNQLKNKKVLIQGIWDTKNQQNKERALIEQRDARKAKAAARKERKSAHATTVNVH